MRIILQNFDNVRYKSGFLGSNKLSIIRKSVDRELFTAPDRSIPCLAVLTLKFINELSSKVKNRMPGAMAGDCLDAIASGRLEKCDSAVLRKLESMVDKSVYDSDRSLYLEHFAYMIPKAQDDKKIDRLSFKHIYDVSGMDTNDVRALLESAALWELDRKNRQYGVNDLLVLIDDLITIKRM